MDNKKFTKDSRGVVQKSEDNNKCMEMVGIILSYLLLIVFFPISIFFCVIVVPEYQRVVLLRCGRFRKRGVRGPGVVFVLPCVDDVIRVDMRTTSLDVPAQDAPTKESISIKVEAVVHFHVRDPERWILQVADARMALGYLAQTRLRAIIGTKKLNDLLSHREETALEVFYSLHDPAEVWGVNVERVEISDITLPSELYSSLEAVREVGRQAKAKISAADNELATAELLKEASNAMSDDPTALQLRYLRTLQEVVTAKSHPVVVAFPVDIVRKINEVLGCNLKGEVKRNDGYQNNKNDEVKSKGEPTYLDLDLEPVPEMKDASVQLSDKTDESQ